MSIRDLLGKKVILCDGAMGTMMQARGMVPGQLPEALNFTHPEMIEEIYDSYLEAGSDLICTNTFGANRWKLGELYTVEEAVGQAVSIAKRAAEKSALARGVENRKEEGPFVAQDLAPLGKLMAPIGELTFEEACNCFKEQIKAGVEAGVDLLFFETFTDIYELKAGIIAAKETCDLPIFCSVTFQEDGRLLMGADPLTVITALQDLGIDALGVNCSLGPKEILPIVKQFLKHSRLPILVQPNAGMPREENGVTVYDVGPAEFTAIMKDILEAGADMVGGCCGTTPEYIRQLAAVIKDGAWKKRLIPAPVTAVCSGSRTVILDDRIRVIGERINPTGKKRLKEALQNKEFQYVEDEAIRQSAAGASILDVNVGLPGIDEKAMMLKAVKRISQVTDAPLQIDSTDPEVLESAVRNYKGKPIINSVNGKKAVMDAVLPIAQKYGACLVALALDEKGLPESVEERIAIVERILNEAARYGIGRERILVDCLTLTVSAQQEAGADTLEAIRQVKARFGVKTILGVSNVSFGLPDRKRLNNTFLAMALAAGLDAPITDPLEPEYMGTVRAFEALTGRDPESVDYIAAQAGPESVGKKAPGEAKNAAPAGESTTPHLGRIILDGRESMAAAAARELLKTEEPLAIVEGVIIPALEIVGKEYEKGETFLPQLIKSADTVKSAFSVLRETMQKSGNNICYGRIVLATVSGDIHDIGKNIVKVLLENYGYEILDLGKDAPIELVVDTVRRENIEMVGLSALMTTTVVNMEKTIRALKEARLDCRIAVGGAVLTQAYADRIGADFYCKDAMDTVRVANSIFKL